jgi:hypothetical protein
MVMCEGEMSYANEYSCIDHIDFTIFCFIFWYWLSIEYDIKNVLDHGNYVPFNYHFDCR